MRQHPTAPVVVRISVATSGTEFTAPAADFVPFIRAAGFCPGTSHLSGVGTAPGKQKPRTVRPLASPAANVLVLR